MPDTCSRPLILADLKEKYWEREWAKFTKRFWSKVYKTDGCWEWKGPVKNGWYGRITLPYEDSSTAAHRVSWLIHFDVLPPGMLVLHRCDNPRCVRPDHLFLGTQQENVSDMRAKGRARYVSGEKHRSAKLTHESVEAARREYSAGGITVRGLAAKHGMTNGAMWQALNHKTWKSH